MANTAAIWVAITTDQGVEYGHGAALLTMHSCMVLGCLSQLLWVLTSPQTYTWRRRYWLMLGARLLRLGCVVVLFVDQEYWDSLPLLLEQKVLSHGARKAAWKGVIINSMAFFPFLHCLQWLPLDTGILFESASLVLLLGRLDRTVQALTHPDVLPGTRALCASMCNVLLWLSGAAMPPSVDAAGATSEQPGPPEGLCRLITPRWLVAFVAMYVGFILPAFLVHYVWERRVVEACCAPAQRAPAAAAAEAAAEAGVSQAVAGGHGSVQELVMSLVCVYVPMLLLLALTLSLCLFLLSDWS